jgi:hypothetical protein
VFGPMGWPADALLLCPPRWPPGMANHFLDAKESLLSCFRFKMKDMAHLQAVYLNVT